MEINKKTLIVKLKGELDHHNSETTRNKIDRYFVEKGLDNIILDLTEITFMDSSGIGLIMGRYKNTVSKKGKLIVVNNNSYIDRILKMSGILKIIELYPTLDDAITKL